MLVKPATLQTMETLGVQGVPVVTPGLLILETMPAVVMLALQVGQGYSEAQAQAGLLVQLQLQSYQVLQQPNIAEVQLLAWQAPQEQPIHPALLLVVQALP